MIDELIIWSDQSIGASYYGTDKSIVGVLFNNSPEPLDFIAVLEEDAVGQEAVCYFYIINYTSTSRLCNCW